MQPIRQIFEEAPDAIPVPEELRRHRIEFILWPLDEKQPDQLVRRRPSFHVADVEVIDIPSRDERNARR
jgi:hypothetical protein